MRGRPKKLDADKLLDVAIDAYWKADPADVSVNTICQLAAVSKPSVYREFGSEDGLTKAALDRYADNVLGDVFNILERGDRLGEILAKLVEFACDDPRLATGCMFYKMRNGKHRFGPETQARIETLDHAAEDAYRAVLHRCRAEGDDLGGIPVDTGAHYLGAQIGLAIMQRAAGESSEQVRASLELALSVFSNQRRGDALV